MTPKYGEGVVRISGNGLCGNCIDPKGWIKFGSARDIVSSWSCANKLPTKKKEEGKEGNRQDNSDGGRKLDWVFEKDGDESEGIEGDASEVVSGMSLGRSSCESRELRLPSEGPALVGDLRIACGLDHLAEAGVDGDLNALLREPSDRGVWKRGDSEEEEEDGATEEGDSNLEGTCVDSPTKPGPLSAMTKASYSKAALFCMMLGASPNPLVVWFHGSLNWGCRDGDPITDDETDAPDSDEAERTGGWFSNDWETDWGDPDGLNCWKGTFTPCAMPS
jgi:hypothetical protein